MNKIWFEVVGIVIGVCGIIITLYQLTRHKESEQKVISKKIKNIIKNIEALTIEMKSRVQESALKRGEGHFLTPITGSKKEGQIDDFDSLVECVLEKIKSANTTNAVSIIKRLEYVWQALRFCEQTDEEGASYFTDSFIKISDTAVELKDDRTYSRAISQLASVAKTAIDNDWFLVYLKITDYLQEVGKTSVAKDLEKIRTETIRCLQNIGEKASSFKEDSYLDRIIISLGEIGVQNNVFWRIRDTAFDLIGRFSLHGAKRRNGHTVALGLKYLTIIGRRIWEKSGCAPPMYHLRAIGEEIINNRFYQDIWWHKAFGVYLVEDTFEYLGKLCAKSIAVENFVKDLVELGKLAAKKGFFSGVECVTGSIKRIAEENCKSGGAELDLILKSIGELEQNGSPALRKKVDELVRCLTEVLIELDFAPKKDVSIDHGIYTLLIGLWHLKRVEIADEIVSLYGSKMTLGEGEERFSKFKRFYENAKRQAEGFVKSKEKL